MRIDLVAGIKLLNTPPPQQPQSVLDAQVYHSPSSYLYTEDAKTGWRPFFLAPSKIPILGIELFCVG